MNDNNDKKGGIKLVNSPSQVYHRHYEYEEHKGSGCYTIHPHLQLPICGGGGSSVCLSVHTSTRHQQPLRAATVHSVRASQNFNTSLLPFILRHLQKKHSRQITVKFHLMNQVPKIYLAAHTGTNMQEQAQKIRPTGRFRGNNQCLFL